MMSPIMPLSILCAALIGQSIDFSGQLTSTFVAGQNPAITLRYLPRFNLDVHRLQVQVIPNLLATSRDPDRTRVDPYRLWLRYSSPQLQLTGGLQKINFGPAKLLRSLQWFDQLDPRDPTQATGGVWGFSSIYSTPHNQVFWLWSLYGEKVKYSDLNDQFPEWGGRWEQLLGPLELGTSWHTRRLADPAGNRSREIRVGLDGYIEPGPGLWFEASLSHYSDAPGQRPATILNTVGADYTWPWGDGFYSALEGMQIITDTGTTAFWAALFRYPLSWIDSISLLAFYRPETAFAMVYFQWQRTLDNWDLLGGIFASTPSDLNVLPTGETVGTGTSGVQVLLIYNY